ncbi:MAG TPA: porin [Planctomycetota bacterium]|nr:porin [Planctomycetota bacterium]
MLPLLLALAAQGADEVPVEVFLKEGLRFRTADGAFEGRVGGRILAQYRGILDRPDDDAPPLRSVPDAAFLRQARIELETFFRKEWYARIATDFATGTWNQPAGTGPSATTATLRDAYVEWRARPELQVRVGQMHLPVSQEELASIRFLEWLERSPMNRLVPGRDIGAQASGTLFDGRFGYAVMAANGGGLLQDQGRAVADREDEKELGALLRAWPHPSVRLTLSGSLASVDSAPVSGFDLSTVELSVLWLDADGPGTFDGRRRRVLPAVAAAVGPVGLAAEALFREDELDGSFAQDRIRSRGFYAGASVFLTGEDKAIDRRPVPLGPWGALEAALRVGRLEIDDPFEAGLASAAGNADRVTSYTAGLNWWVTPIVRLSGNVVHERYSDELDFRSRREDRLTGFLVRLQIDY